MKLLFALPGFHRYDRGAEVALLSVADALALSGDNVTVMGSGEIRPETAYDFQQVPSIRRERFEKLPTFPPLRSETAWEDMTFAAQLLRRYNPIEYDAVITCSFPFTHLALRRPARRRPLQIFVTQNGDWPAYNNSSEYRSFSCDGLICTNPDYQQRNCGRWSTALIPNGVDLKRFSPDRQHRLSVRRRLGLPVDKQVVLMVSAFIDTKRVLDGIRAVAELDDVVLVVAGDGPLRDQARTLAEMMLPNRYYQMSISAREMPDLYRCSDAFLHMSLLESFGNVFLEAWACGLPIVGHKTERLCWILGDNTSHLCDTENRGETVAMLSSALQIQDESRQVSAQIIDYGWETIAQRYRDFINELR